MRTTSMPWLAWLIGFLLMAAPKWAQCDAVIREDRSTGGMTVLMENQFVSVAVSPFLGGRVTGFVDKNTGLDYATHAYDMGLFSDMLWQQLPFSSGDWLNKPYSYEIIRRANGKVGVRLARSGKKGSLSWLTIQKTFWLADGRAALDVDYEFKVDPNAMRTLTICPWFHHGLMIKGAKSNLYIPTSRGVQTIPYDSAAVRNESFHYDVTRGWYGMVAPSRNAGAVFTMDYTRLMCMYNWQGTSGNTVEWMFRSQAVPHGKSFATHATLMPISGLTRIDGASSGIAGQFIMKKGKPCGVRIFSAQARNIKVSVTSRRLPGALRATVLERDLACSCAKAVDSPFALAPDGDGTYVIECVVRDPAGTTVLEYETPITVGRASAQYVMQAKQARLGSDKERFGKLIMNEADIVDPCTYTDAIPSKGIPWNKPSLGGKIRVLALTDMTCARELIELAARTDINLSTCTYSSYGHCNWHPIWGHSGGKTQINAYLSKLLANDYDCILFGGMQFNSITPENLSKIAEKVRRGAGLVTIMPTHIPQEYADLFPAAPLLQESYSKIEKAILKTADFRVVKTAELTAGLPLSGLPQTYLFPYTPKGDVLISAGGKPFLITGEAAKGRTALFTWLVGRPDNTKRGGLNPYFDQEPAYPYHEYYYSMLIKAIRWAARRSPQIAVRGIKMASPDTVALDIRSDERAPYPAHIELTLRHESNTVLATVKRSVTVAPGTNTFRTSIDFQPMHGTTFVDVRVLVQNAVADFGSAAYRHEGAVSIHDVVFDKRIYREGERFQAEVALAGKRAAEAGVQATLTDAYGRLLYAGSAAREGEGADFAVSIPLQHLYAHMARLEVSVLIGRTLLDRRTIEVLLAPASLTAERRWGRYRVMLSWPRRADRALPLYLHSMRRDALRDLGIDTQLMTGVPVFWGHDREQFYLSYRQGFALVFEGVSRLSHRSGLPYYKRPVCDYVWNKTAFKRLREDYGKTRDKKYLQRNPSLDDPVYLNDFKQAMLKWTKTLVKWTPVYYDLGDEGSYTLYTNEIDFDFSPVSLQAFRTWLRNEVYDRLEALNKEWRTDFGAWGEVVPPTAVEARKSGNYAGWADHRTYNEKVFADFNRCAQQTIREADHGALVGISGTQVPKAYGGHDWSRLMPIFQTLSAYSGGGLPSIYRSFAHIPLMGWTGYGADRDALWRGVWTNLFNGHYGVALYNEDVFFQPDLSPTRSARDLKQVLAPIRAGLGTLLYACGLKKPDIAIHYSQPSVHAAWIKQGQQNFVDTRLGWIRLLSDLGFEYEFVSYRDIEKGTLIKKRYKALVLPWSMAISGKEVAAILAFEEAGGAVIADKEPGIMNEHCTEMPTHRMAAVFAMKNRSVLLNESLEHYGESGSVPEGLKKRYAAIFARLGLAARKDIVVHGNIRTSRYVYALGTEGEIIGFLPAERGSTTITAAKGEYLYDVLRGVRLMSGRMPLKPNRPTVVARLPYEVLGVDVSASRRARGVEVAAHLRASSPPEFHVVRFDVLDPDGNRADLYSAVVKAPRGKAVHRFYPALNHKKGAWTIRCTDIVTGAKASSKCVLD